MYFVYENSIDNINEFKIVFENNKEKNYCISYKKNLN